MPKAVDVRIFHNLLEIVINETVQEGVGISPDGEEQKKANLRSLARVILCGHNTTRLVPFLE